MNVFKLYFLSLSICEIFAAQRQVGETSLNDTSSRSHQIIRLASSETCKYLSIIVALYNNMFQLFLVIVQTIESIHRESSDCVRSYVASLVKQCFWLHITVRKHSNGWRLTMFFVVVMQNFVDLAGSERASQTNAEGARLREGCHINLSLMTLTTVIRKLRSEVNCIVHFCIFRQDSELQ